MEKGFKKVTILQLQSHMISSKEGLGFSKSAKKSRAIVTIKWASKNLLEENWELDLDLIPTFENSCIASRSKSHLKKLFELSSKYSLQSPKRGIGYHDTIISLRSFQFSPRWTWNSGELWTYNLLIIARSILEFSVAKWYGWWSAEHKGFWIKLLHL